MIPVGYRYDFTVKGKRYTKAWFRTKAEAKAAEKARRQQVAEQMKQAPETDMGFLDLMNLRLDYLTAHGYSQNYYEATRYVARRALKEWGNIPCHEITPLLAEKFLIKRKTESEGLGVNDDLAKLRATFSWAKERGRRYVSSNPFEAMKPFPNKNAKKDKRTPTPDELDRVIEAAAPANRPYLWVVRETMARSVEVNRLTWDRVHFEEQYVELQTFKNRGRNAMFRKVAMTQKLFEVLSELYEQRDPEKPWVFWHSYVPKNTKKRVEGPYKKGRRSMLKAACKNAGVEYFTLHRIRASGASLMDEMDVPLSSIQRILGHGDRRSTEIYLEQMREVQREAIDVFEQASRTFQKSSHENPHRKKPLVRKAS